MIVKCIEVLGFRGDNTDYNPWVTVGNEYFVVAIDVEHDGTVLQILTNDGSLRRFSASDFNTVDSTVPPHWVISLSDDGQISIGPEAWNAVGFWESYYDDRDPATIELVETGIANTLAAHDLGTSEDTLESCLQLRARGDM